MGVLVHFPDCTYLPIRRPSDESRRWHGSIEYLNLPYASHPWWLADGLPTYVVTGRFASTSTVISAATPEIRADPLIAPSGLRSYLRLLAYAPRYVKGCENLLIEGTPRGSASGKACPACSATATRSRWSSDARTAGATGRFSGPTASGKFPTWRAYGTSSLTVTTSSYRRLRDQGQTIGACPTGPVTAPAHGAGQVPKRHVSRGGNAVPSGGSAARRLSFKPGWTNI